MSLMERSSLHCPLAGWGRVCRFSVDGLLPPHDAVDAGVEDRAAQGRPLADLGVVVEGSDLQFGEIVVEGLGLDRALQGHCLLVLYRWFQPEEAQLAAHDAVCGVVKVDGVWHNDGELSEMVEGRRGELHELEGLGWPAFEREALALAGSGVAVHQREAVGLQSLPRLLARRRKA